MLHLGSLFALRAASLTRAPWLACLALLATVSTAPVAAQVSGGVLEGRVLGDQGRPLAGALVQIEALRLQALSNAEGRFTLRGIPTGTHTIVLSSVGFGSERFPLPVGAGEVVRRDFTLSVNPLSLEELVVQGQVGQAEAFNRQRNAPSIRNVVSSEQFERFPDPQVPDALRRIPGVAGQPDRGETGYIFIRGLSPDFTTVTVNGSRVPSTDQEGRAVELSSIPSQMLESVEVIKAITPDMDADAVGGSINLVQRRPTVRQFDGRIEGGTHTLAGGTNTRAGLNYANAYGNWGFTVGGEYASQFRQTENSQFAWGTWQDQQVLNRFMIQHYPIERTRYSLNASAQVDLGPATHLYARGFLSRYDTKEERHRMQFRLDNGTRVSATEATSARVIRQARQYTWQRAIYDLTLGGEHAFGGGVQVDFAGSFSRARRTEPYRNYFEFRQDGVDTRLDPSADRDFPVLQVTNDRNVNDPAAFRMMYFEQRLDDNRDNDLGGQVNVSVPLRFSDLIASSLRFGGKLSIREKNRDTSEATLDDIQGSFTMASMATDGFVDPVIRGRYAFGPRVEWAAGESFWAQNRNLFSGDENEIRENADTEDYQASETIASVYGMATLDFGSIEVVAGARYEHTDMAYDGKRLLFDASGNYVSTTPVTSSSSYGTLFPALHVRYRVNPSTNLRAAATRTISRPSFLRLAPNEYVRPDDEIVRRGNPDLRPALATNLDLLAEHYFASVGTIQAGVFFKDITDFFFNRRAPIASGPFAGWELIRPENGASASVYGLEFAWQQRLSFLPGIWSGLGAYANYTWTDTDSDYGGTTNRNLPLVDQFRHVGNVALTYDGYGFSGLVSLNHQSDFLESISSNPAADRYGRYRNQVDASFSQRVTSNLRLTLHLNNLTNEPYVRYLPGLNGVPYENEYEGRWGSLGLRFNF
jgi:TonB-dependent receptor